MTSDLDYFLLRAEAELSLAQVAEHPAAVKAHYTLAGYYLDTVYRDGISKAPPLSPAFVRNECG